MDQRTLSLFFALLRSAVRGNPLTKEEKETYSPEMLPALLEISAKQDLVHLLAFALKQNALLRKEDSFVEKNILKAVFRYERLNFVLREISEAFEAVRIPFVLLKGSVLRDYYPEAWMRTSCDIDVLVHRDDLERAIEHLTSALGYEEKQRETHDVSLFTPGGVHVELHFDLVEEGRANNAMGVLRSVWDDVTLCEGCFFSYRMSDAFFYFYHVAHMAKHFETGGCGVRPFLDLWILDHMEQANFADRDAILSRGELLKFTEAARKLSRVWFGGEEMDALSVQLQNFLLAGGIYGSSENRVALQQKKKGGRFGYLLSRIFIPYDKLRRYYPILEKHRWLTPVMQVRRWFMLLRPEVAAMAKREMETNRNLQKGKADEMGDFLKEIGL